MKHEEQKFKHTIGTEGNLNLLQFNALRALKNCNRFSGLQLIHPMSVALHCYYTGLLFQIFADYEQVEFTVRDLLLVLKHDVLESVTGDMLHPAKQFNSDVKTLWDRIEKILINSANFSFLAPFSDQLENFSSEEVFGLFKLADILELYIYMCEEMALGNISRDVRIVINNVFGFLCASCREHPLVDAFINKYHCSERCDNRF